MPYEDSGNYGWDDAVTYDGPSGYTLLEPGEHAFTVVAFKRSHFGGSEKMAPCDMGIYTLDFGTVRVDYRLYLNSMFKRRTFEFFQSIRLIDADADPGTVVRFPWDSCVGARGVAVTKVREWNGREYNEIDRCVVPSAQSYGTM